MELMVLVKVDLMSSLSIGEVARRSGKAASAIRYYESIGLLPTAQRESGRRLFPEETLRTLHVIDTARNAGLTLDEIKVLLAGGEPLGAIAARRLAALDAQRTWLAHAADCTCVDLDDCALFA
jgi:MerR family transcriptional regulator, redox-sensitive transcriptional activator SoxR